FTWSATVRARIGVATSNPVRRWYECSTHESNHQVRFNSRRFCGAQVVATLASFLTGAFLQLAEYRDWSGIVNHGDGPGLQLRRQSNWRVPDAAAVPKA